MEFSCKGLLQGHSGASITPGSWGKSHADFITVFVREQSKAIKAFGQKPRTGDFLLTCCKVSRGTFGPQYSTINFTNQFILKVIVCKDSTTQR
jgi:hypothetical protein